MAGRKPPILWSSEAETDLADIWNYYAGVAGHNVADTMIRNIGEACRILEDHPLGGRSRDEIRSGLRSVVTSPYVIFYRVNNDTAEIVRVLDGRRDIEEIFSGD
ncbi:MAG: type II toxin-antitoxin system RelE/ParE family toxin [Methyloceanibacter sp.]|uniref:type II toxin-antitoxin system RelE/ParE family toxin n=1 Tax=Methyloceanibacter sp. TaxID=1965321 RepID=UPI003D9B3312